MKKYAQINSMKEMIHILTKENSKRLKAGKAAA
jgi:hypothetical protein